MKIKIIIIKEFKVIMVEYQDQIKYFLLMKFIVKSSNSIDSFILFIIFLNDLNIY